MIDAKTMPDTASQNSHHVGQSLLTEDGLIRPHEACPFVGRCEIAATGACHHRGVEHEIHFSCAVARGFDMTKRRDV